MPPHPSFALRKEHYEKLGLYKTDMSSAADYELMLRMLYKNRITAAYIPGVSVRMRMGGVSNVSLRNRIRANKSDRRAWTVNNVQPRFYTLFAKPLLKIGQYV